MKEYEFDENSLHWKLYMIGIAMWAEFLHNGLWKYERPNVCSYIRTLCIYLPATLVLNVAIYTSPIWVIGLIYHYFSMDILIETFIWFAWLRWVIPAAVIVVIFAILLQKLYTRPLNAEGGKKNNIAQVKTEDPTSFTRLILQYSKDQHDMICRPIVAKKMQLHKESKDGIS